MQALWIALGGAVGTLARYGVAVWFGRRFGAAFPYGTLVVNVVGAFVIVVVVQLSLRTTHVSPTVRLALTTGVLGGFTTFSTFTFETLAMLEQGALHLAALNVALTLIGGLGAALGAQSLCNVLLR